MPDMLVKLYTLPEIGPALSQQVQKGVDIRRALAPEKHHVVNWVKSTFSDNWASECEVAFARQPVACFLAIENNQLLGFACYEATYKNFFGPTGIRRDFRGRGIGKALLLASLHAMRAEGYAYAIVGWADEAIEFYAKSVDAMVIEDSFPGIFRGMLR